MKVLEGATGLVGVLCEIGEILIEEWRWTVSLIVGTGLVVYAATLGWMRALLALAAIGLAVDVILYGSKYLRGRRIKTFILVIALASAAIFLAAAAVFGFLS